jgi:hypothetical protein
MAQPAVDGDCESRAEIFFFATGGYEVAEKWLGCFSGYL